MARRTACPITRNQFHDSAESVIVQIGDDRMEADVKEFSTGSLGWYLNGKTKIQVDGVKVPVQIGLSLTIVGSKDLPQDKEADVEVEAA